MNRSRTRIGLGALIVATVLATGCGGYVVSSGPYGRPYYPPADVHYGFRGEQFAALAHELDDRAARAHELAETYAAGSGPRAQEFFEEIHHFSDRARTFHVRYERGAIRDTGQLRDELQHLLEDAQATDSAIRQARVYAEIYDEWTGVINVLNRMLQIAR